MSVLRLVHARRRKRAPRVLVVIQNMPLTLDRRVRQECRALIDAGYGVSVICPRGVGQGSYQVVDGVHVHTYRAPRPAVGAMGYAYEFAYCWIRTVLLSLRVLVKEGFDVIQACNPPDTYFAMALLYRPLGKRFVYDQHDLCPEVYTSRFDRDGGILLQGIHLLERLTYRTADHVIVTNDSYRDIALDRGRLDPASVTVVRSGPDPSQMVRGEPVPELRRGRKYLCTWLGIMGPQDGVDHLLRSIAFVVHDLGRDDCHFALLGYGDCLNDLKELSSALELDPWVTFTGRADAAMIAHYLSTSEIGLSADPSNPLNDVSTMNKTMEYMAYRLPVVAYDLKETRVSAGEGAVYVAPDDATGQAYAKAISDLLDSPRQRTEMGLIGRRRVEESLSWQDQVGGYLAVFEAVVGQDHCDGSSLTASSPGDRNP